MEESLRLLSDQERNSDSQETTSKGDESKTPSLPRARQIVFVALLVLQLYFNYVTYSLPASFYPQVAAHRKGSKADTEVGFMVGAIQLSAFISGMFVGARLESLGVKFSLICGSLLLGGGTVIFSFVTYIPQWVPFIGLSIAIRLVMGFGQGAADTAASSMLVNMFSSHTATVWAVIGMACSVGEMSGSPIGGVLYDNEGFLFPFVLIGCVVLLYIPLLIIIPSSTVLSSQAHSDNRISVWSFLKMMPVQLICVNMFFSSAPLPILETSLAVHLHNAFDWHATHIGLVFLLAVGTYIVSSVPVGILVDATEPRVIMAIGLLVEGCSMMLVGPSFVFSSLSPEPWNIYLSMVLLGVGAAMTMTSAPVDLTATAVSRGYERNLALDGLVSGLATALMGLAGVVCAPVSGALTTAFGFRHSTSFFAFVLFLLFILTAISLIIKKTLSKREQSNSNARV